MKWLTVTTLLLWGSLVDGKKHHKHSHSDDSDSGSGSNEDHSQTYHSLPNYPQPHQQPHNHYNYAAYPSAPATGYYGSPPYPYGGYYYPQPSQYGYVMPPPQQQYTAVNPYPYGGYHPPQPQQGGLSPVPYGGYYPPPPAPPQLQQPGSEVSQNRPQAAAYPQYLGRNPQYGGGSSTIDHSLKVNKEYKEKGHHYRPDGGSEISNDIE